MSQNSSFNVFFSGTVTAVTPLTVTMPGKEYAPTKDTPSKLPRKHIHAEFKENQHPYYPASGVLGWLRRALTRDVMNHLPEASMPAEVYYLLSSGGAEGFQGGNTRDIGAKIALRQKNPVESAFGSFRLSARTGVGNLHPKNESLVPPVMRGIRTNDAIRTPEIVNQFDEANRDKILERIGLDRGLSLKKKEKDDLVRDIKKEAKEAKKHNDFDKVDELWSEIRRIEDGYTADSNKHVPIQNIYQGYEYFPEDQTFNHKMSLHGASLEDIGVMLAALRAGSAQPRIGGHWHHDCGWIRADYVIKMKPVGDYGPALSVGRIVIDPEDGFTLETDDETLKNSLDLYDQQASKGFPDWPGVREPEGLSPLTDMKKKNDKSDNTEKSEVRNG